MKSTLLEQVQDRLGQQSSSGDSLAQHIERAIYLSDKYASVKPEEYVLPLTLSLRTVR